MTGLFKYKDLPHKKAFGHIYISRLSLYLMTDHYDEEKENEHDAKRSFIVLVTQRVTGSLLYNI